MSVAVTLTISDGLIMGVDSAVTISFGVGKTNIYEDAEKLFQLGEKRIGIATVGMAGIGERSIGSFIREFESKDPDGAMARSCPLDEVVESLRKFFYEPYATIIIPAVEQLQGMPFDQVPPANRPALGLLVGGYSDGEFLPELWQIAIPEAKVVGSAQQLQKRGTVGLTWHAVSRPIHRYIKGFDAPLLAELDALLLKLLKRPLTPGELKEFQDIFARNEYQFVYGSMPVNCGVRFVRSLVNLVIEHYRMVAEDSVVGGEARIGVVTYKGDKFQILK
jgi:hypothetical protein